MISVLSVLMLGHEGVYLRDPFIILLCKKCEARFHFSRNWLSSVGWGGMEHCLQSANHANSRLFT